ncbi:HD domain-containing phosphohydrolase [Paenarthrobacter sp. Z7-10]|uniref:HD domain-containing phosphohydrolase n=1 Tax=Paenarthrobacter sp. Z7-10 TaxID=2787635 RepID=UPI0022A9452B|nr:HD domain-containing phosphohydrolase [Paenarthrobacter sp. Z7-10]
MPVRRCEILAALSLAIDLGLGQPMEHMLRSCLLALRIADRTNANPAERGSIYYAHLLAWIGCHADSFELAAMFSDDIAFRADYYTIDQRGLPMYKSFFSHTGAALPPVQQAISRTRFALTGRGAVQNLIRSHCTSAGELARRVGLDENVCALLTNTFERWDGKGLPEGRKGPDIPLGTRITNLAETIEVFLRAAGVQGAVEMVRKRRGTQFDPELTDLFCANAVELTDGLLDQDPWPAALAAAPEGDLLAGTELDAVLRAIGDFADLKSPYTTGHSREVASLAAEAGREHGLAPDGIAVLRRAGWVHDIGRMGVSNGVWDKKGELSQRDTEHLQMHPYLGERILSRVPGMRSVAELVGSHHERLDGSGYPRGLGEQSLNISQRILAAADSYRTYLEPRPHRAALSPDGGAERLLAEVAAGRLDGAAVDAVLVAAGQRRRRPRVLPGGVTPREAEILKMLCHGMSTADIAGILFISPKTVRNHVEHIYLKIGASNRVGATLYAVEHGL